MSNPFFEKPILNSPYACPLRHWELDSQGQPTQKILEARRRAQFITPIPKPRKRKGSADQEQIIFDEGKGLSTRRRSASTRPETSRPICSRTSTESPKA
jgi:type III restriction enzyme